MLFFLSKKIPIFVPRNSRIIMFDYHTLQLANGMRLVHCCAPTQVAYCGIMVNCGTRNELSPEFYGIAHFIEHILFKGTRKRDSWHINNRMESVGGELNAFTTKEDTTFYSVFLPQDFGRAVELLFDLLFDATAPQHELEKEQEVVIEEIESYRDNPSELIYDLFEEQLFAGTALGHNILGTAETVRRFDSRMCLDFLAANYTPDRMVFFSYGPMKWDAVVRQVEKYQPGEIAARNREVLPMEAAAVRKSAAVTPQEATENGHFAQSHVILGGPTYPIGHPNAAALALLNNLLGGPGMNSRLNLQLRERNGLVYTVESNLTSYTDTGYFSIYYGCDHDEERRCERLCRRELQRLLAKPLSDRQLQAAKKQLKGQMGIATANLENSAISLAKNIMRRGRIESLEEVCQRIDDVTSQQMQAVAEELFDDSRLLTVVLK